MEADRNRQCVKSRAVREATYRQGRFRNSSDCCEHCISGCFHCCMDYDGSGLCRIGCDEDDIGKGKTVQPWGTCDRFQWGHWVVIPEHEMGERHVFGKRPI